MRILHTADWQLGSGLTIPESFQRQSIALEEFIEHARSGYDVIVIAGDVFQRGDPPQQIKDLFLATLGALSDIPVLVIPGNHDYEDKHSTGYHSLVTLSVVRDKLEALANVHLFSEPTIFDLHDIRFALVPSKDFCTEAFAALKSDAPDIVVAHGTVAGSFASNGFTLSHGLSAAALMDTNARYIALGDIHARQRVIYAPGIQGWYPGALFQTTFGEPAERCGFLDVHIEKEGQPTVIPVQLQRPRRLVAVTGIVNIPSNAVVDLVMSPSDDTELAHAFAAEVGSILKSCVAPAVSRETASRIEGMSESTTYEQDLDLFLEAQGDSADQALVDEAHDILREVLSEGI